MTSQTFVKGDRYVVTSVRPTYTEYDGDRTSEFGYRDVLTPNYERAEVDSDGDIYMRRISDDAVGHINADHVASEPATFKAGDRVVVKDAHYRYGRERHSLPILDGEIGTVVDTDTDADGDLLVDFKGDGGGRINPACLTLVEPEPTPTPPSIGSASIRVDVRFFIGDRDITSLISLPEAA